MKKSLAILAAVLSFNVLRVLLGSLSLIRPASSNSTKARPVLTGSLGIDTVAPSFNNINDPRIQKLAKALHSDEVRQFILTRYKGQIAPGF